jgi:hypothetical protein
VHDSRRVIGQEIAALPGNATVGFIKVSAKPLKASLATWASKWVYLFTHYLQVRRGAVWVGGWVWLHVSIATSLLLVQFAAIFIPHFEAWSGLELKAFLCAGRAVSSAHVCTLRATGVP